MPSRPISRSPSFITFASGDTAPPVPHYGAVAQPSNVTVVRLRPSAGPQTLSFHHWPAPPKPTLAAQIVAARPHRVLDHVFERSTQALGRRAQKLMLRAPIVDHDAWLLALLITTCAAVGSANLMHEIGRSWLDRKVEDPVRRGIDAVGRHGGRWASVPLALGYDGVFWVVALMLNGTACLTGVMVGSTAAVAAAPLLLGMPVHLRKTLADGLRAYLTLQQRLATVDRLMNEWTFTPPRKLSAALEGLQRHIDALTHRAPPHEEAPPAHMHFHFIKDLMAEHPNAARRLGLPRLPTEERLLPIKERLLHHTTQRRRSEELAAAGRRHRFMFGAAS